MFVLLALLVPLLCLVLFGADWLERGLNEDAAPAAATEVTDVS